MHFILSYKVVLWRHSSSLMCSFCHGQVLNPKKKGKKKKYINSGTVSAPTSPITACHFLCIAIYWCLIESYSSIGIITSYICFFSLAGHLFSFFCLALVPLPPSCSVYRSVCVLVCVCLPGNTAVLQSGVWVYLCGFHPRRVSRIIISPRSQWVSTTTILRVCVFVRVSLKIMFPKSIMLSTTLSSYWLWKGEALRKLVFANLICK